MYRKITFALFIMAITATGFAAPGGDQKDRDAQIKLALDELKNEVIVLKRQVRDMQAAMDRNSGQMNALINQIVDNVNAIRQAQSRVAEGSASAINQTNNLGEQLSATNQRIERLSGQMAELKRLVENLPKMPTMMQITPGNPDQLFAAAYGDYSRGNYDLAISEFRQYVETYPSSEMADNAQYWIGESLYAKKQLSEALAEFDRVISGFAKGDKVPAARFKKGMVLIELGQPEAGRAELSTLIRLFPRSNEAQLARQQLNEK